MFTHLDGHLAVQLVDDRQEVVEETTAKLTDQQLYYGLKVPSPVTEIFSEMFVSKFDSDVVWLVTYVTKVSIKASLRSVCKNLKFASPGGRDAEHRHDGQHRGQHRGRPHLPLEEAEGGVQEPRRRRDPLLRRRLTPNRYLRRFLCIFAVFGQSLSPSFCQSSSVQLSPLSCGWMWCRPRAGGGREAAIFVVFS